MIKKSRFSECRLSAMLIMSIIGTGGCTVLSPEKEPKNNPPLANTANKNNIASSNETPEKLNSTDRMTFLAELDNMLAKPDSEISPEVVDYYHKMIDNVIDGLEKTKVKNGIVVWKLYSNSVIVKTPDCIFALDLCEGPNRNLQKHIDIPLSFTIHQRQKLAELIDYSFHTHCHADHISLQMVDAMTKLNKKIFVTNETLALWADRPFKNNLTVPQEGVLHLEHLTVYVHHGIQHMKNNDDECFAYLIETNDGIHILEKGDIFDGNEYALYLDKLKANNLKIDLFISSAWTGRGKDIISETERCFNPFVIPTHEWEFTHRKPGAPGNATQSYIELYKRLEPQITLKKSTILTWGEHYYFTKLAITED